MSTRYLNTSGVLKGDLSNKKLIISAVSHYFWSKTIVAAGIQLDIDCMSVKLRILCVNREEKSRYMLKTLSGVLQPIPISKKNAWISPQYPHLILFPITAVLNHCWLDVIWFDFHLGVSIEYFSIHCIIKVWLVISILHSKYCQENV